MSRVKGLAARLRSLLRRESAERRMEEEFAFHVEMEAARLRTQGVPPDEALRMARAHFGGFDRYREEMREGRLAHWLQDLRGDLRYGARMLWKQKLLTVVAIVSLTIGIGANSAIFSIVNSMLLRPRAVADPGQLVQLYVGDRGHPYETASYPSYRNLRDENEVLSGLAAYGLGWQFRLSGHDDVELVWGEVVSGNYFDVLGVRAQLGRTFLPEEDEVPGRNPVVVISHGLWQRRFGSDPQLVGRAIMINNQPLTVIGIAPPQYTGMLTGWASEIWIPAMITPLLDPSRGSYLVSSRGSRWVTMVGRLRPGTTIEEARRQFDLLSLTMQEEHPNEWRKQQERGVRELFITVMPERQSRVPPTLRAPVWAVVALLFVVVDLVLVIACMNLAGMLFARGVARRNEIAVRLALGAGRARVVRQLLAESVLLSLIAGVAGIALASWALSALTAFMPALPEGIRVALDIRLDWWVVACTLAFATVTGLLFGLAPALHASRAAVSSLLQDDSRGFAGSTKTSRARKALVVLQVALSLLLLISAGLVLRSLGNVRPAQLGFASENMVVAPLALDEGTYDRQRSQRFFQEVARSIAVLPDVQAVSLVESMPGGFMGRTRRGTWIEGYRPPAGESLEIDATLAGPRYFTNMGYPILLGRDFDDRDVDGAPCAAIINEAFAVRYFGGLGAALGKHLAAGNGPKGAERRDCAIVGVIRDDAWQSLQAEVRPFFALAALQSDARRMTLLVQTRGDPLGSVSSARQAIRALDPSVPVAGVQTLDEQFDGVLYPFRLLGLVLAGGGLLALLLATLGIYGTVSYAVAQRTREVGIRMALGAVQTDVVTLIVGQGMRLVGYGLALGLLLGAALTRVLDSMPVETTLLFGVGATDAATFAAVTMFLALVALAACYIPALRAARVDPAETLRTA